MTDTGDHDVGLQRMLNPLSWNGQLRRSRPVRRHSLRSIQRGRWRQMAAAEAEAAELTGEYEVAELFLALGQLLNDRGEAA